MFREAEGLEWVSRVCTSHSLVLRLLHSAVYRLPRILKCIFTLAFDTDFDTANSFPLKMGCFPKAHEHHV